MLVLGGSTQTTERRAGVATSDAAERPQQTQTSWIVRGKIRGEQRRADERKASNAENEIEGELVRGDDHGENRLEASTNEDDCSALAEEYEDIQDDVTFADGAGNENAAVFERKYPLDSVLALDADDVASDNEVVKGAETPIVEGDAVDFPEVDFDREDEATLHDAVTEEVLVPAVMAPQTGWRVDRFPQGPAGCAF